MTVTKEVAAATRPSLVTVTVSAVSAILYVFSFPGFNVSWLAWVALVPVTWVALRERPLRAFLLGWLAGTGAYLGILYWLLLTFHAANQSFALGLSCWVLLSAYLGLYWGAWAAFLTVLTVSVTKNESKQVIGTVQNERKGCSVPKNALFSFPVTVTFLVTVTMSAAAWVALEYVKTHLFSGFPWALLGDSQWRHPALIQIASLTGVYGVSFLAALVNVAIAIIMREGIRRACSSVILERGLTQSSNLVELWVKPLLLAVVLVLANFLFGLHRMLSYAREPEHGRPLKVALLQGSIDQYQKWDERYVGHIKQTYGDLSSQAARLKPDLIVWPETSLPGYFLNDIAVTPPALSSGPPQAASPQAELGEAPPAGADGGVESAGGVTRWAIRLIKQSGSSHLLGAARVSPQGLFHNSAFSVSPEGQVLGEYDKLHLVPFGEYVPWQTVLTRWIQVLNDLGGFSPGGGGSVIPCAGVPVSVTICYESTFPSLVRRSVAEGGELIANLTNDAWYMRTAEPLQHFTPCIFRAVENDRWVIRADNTGITGIVNPRGEVQAASRIFEPAVVSGTVYARKGLTFYARHGDLFARACGLAAVLAFLAI